MENWRKLNTTMSHGFRIAVGVHLGCLLVLFFGMRNTLVGTAHLLVRVLLSLLMAAIMLLFVADMASQEEQKRKDAKLIDGVIGSAWIVLIGFLLASSLRI